jgi:S-adenosylmethionine-dependent methyltransferase
MDQNFDDLAHRFNANIYSSGKGAIRFTLLKEDILRDFPEIKNQAPLHILDAGGGMGQAARWLAAMGHKIELCDLSKEMLKIAEEENKKANLDSKININHIPIQKLGERFAHKTFDIILLHGVIEWMADPICAISAITPLLKPNGALSLLYFNKTKLILKWGANHQFEKALGERKTLRRPLTPINPLTEEDIKPELAKQNYKIISKSGIRVFYGFFTKKVNQNSSIDKAIELERKHYRNEPYASLGEHTHITARLAI